MVQTPDQCYINARALLIAARQERHLLPYSIYSFLEETPSYSADRVKGSDAAFVDPQRRGSRAVFQFYPENSQQLELITSQAMKAGFTGGVVVDYPNSTRAKK